MKYMGSKSKIAADIVPILKGYMQKYRCDLYVEPFVGGANVIDKMGGFVRIGADLNKYLIALLNEAPRVCEMPDTITHEHYSDVRDSYNRNTDKYPDWYKGAVGFLASYNGRFFDGGYSGIRKTSEGTERNYYLEAKRNFLAQAERIYTVNFLAGDYADICGEFKNCLIYCDPPYKDTKQYGVSRYFDTAHFWEWARKMAKNNIVLVSEQTAPDGIKCIWEKDCTRTIKYDKTKTATEKLFEVKA